MADNRLGSRAKEEIVAKRATMLEILKNGLIYTDVQLMELVERYGQVVIPGEIEDLDLTHWWFIRDDFIEMLYVGTLETFATFITERNEGVQGPK